MVTNLNAPPGGFSSSFVIDPAPTFTTAGIAGKTVQSATTTRFALGGSSRIGEAWKVTVAGQTYIYTVESKDVIAAKLAAAISATTDAGGAALYAATAEGANLVVVRLAGTFPGFTASVTPRNSFTRAPAAATEATIIPSATPVVGETWTVSIGSAVYRHVVQPVGSGAETRAQIAAALATSINTGVVTGYTAFADGERLVIVHASTFASTTPDLRGHARGRDRHRRGDAERRRGDARGDRHADCGRDLVRQHCRRRQRLLLRAPGRSERRPLADIADGLAAAINGRTADDGFKAIARSTVTTGPYQLVIADAAGGEFTVAFEIKLAGRPHGRLGAVPL